MHPDLENSDSEQEENFLYEKTPVVNNSVNDGILAIQQLPKPTFLFVTICLSMSIVILFWCMVLHLCAFKTSS